MHKKLIINISFQLVIWLTIFVLICYFHPTKETMFCNENKICTIKQEFLYKFTTVKTIKVDTSTKIIKSIKFIPGQRINGSYRLHILYDNIKPFIYYNAYNRFDDTELDTVYNLEKVKFDSYIKSSGGKYTVNSSSTYKDLNIFLIFYFVLFFIWLYVIYVIIDVNNKENYQERSRRLGETQQN